MLPADSNLCHTPLTPKTPSPRYCSIREGGVKVNRPPTEAVLFVDLAELLFQFGNQSVYALRGVSVGRLPRQRTVLDDLDCKHNTLVFLNQKCLLP